MTELVTANGITYECKNVSTGTDSISFTVEGYTAAEMEEALEGVSEITTSYEGELRPHGTFGNLKLESVTKNADDGSVTIKMHIKNEIERRLDALEESQKRQDEAIYGINGASEYKSRL